MFLHDRADLAERKSIVRQTPGLAGLSLDLEPHVRLGLPA